jgi:hypothetical protein
LDTTYENDLEEHLLIYLHELLVPILNIRGLLPAVGVIVVCLLRVSAVVLAPLDDLAEDGFVDVGDRDCLRADSIITEIVDHVLDEHGALGDLAIWLPVSIVTEM